MGVFATRSPFRPNAIGLSSVVLERVEPVSYTHLDVYKRQYEEDEKRRNPPPKKRQQ